MTTKIISVVKNKRRMDYSSTSNLHTDENLCFLCWFPSGIFPNEDAKRVIGERGEILDVIRMTSTVAEAYGWMLYLYTDFSRPYVVDFRTVKNKSRKCGWVGNPTARFSWEIWVWRANPGWASLTRGSAAPLKTFLRALGAGWQLKEREVPMESDYFADWWQDIVEGEKLPVDKWKSVMHIPDSLVDHRRLLDVLYHSVTRQWFTRVPWLTLYVQAEGHLLGWIERQKTEHESWTGMATPREISFLGKKIPVIPPLELSSWLERAR